MTCNGECHDLDDLTLEITITSGEVIECGVHCSAVCPYNRLDSLELFWKPILWHHSQHFKNEEGDWTRYVTLRLGPNEKFVFVFDSPTEQATVSCQEARRLLSFATSM